MAKAKSQTKSGAVRALRPASVSCEDQELDSLLRIEWLRANRRGAYAAGTVVGCNTRRYHGLLVAATKPPLGRVVALSTVMEQVLVNGAVYDLATNEFPNTFSPEGYAHLTRFGDAPAATFVYKVDGATITKRVLLSDTDNAVALRYEVSGPVERLLLRPFTPMRDFHHLRTYDGEDRLQMEIQDNGVAVRDVTWPEVPPLHLTSKQASFEPDPQWWYKLACRVDIERGQDGLEDVWSPGLFAWEPSKNKRRLQLRATLGSAEKVKYKAVVVARQDTEKTMTAAVASRPRAVRRLAAAAETFLVDRQDARGGDGLSILAGFPWFGDWGRDAFIALPGLLVSTRRFDLARQVFRTWSSAVSEGMIPNRFDDYGGQPHYNSVDASLWFIVALERYLDAVADDESEALVTESFWGEMAPICEQILTAYAEGTRFDIHATQDGLLSAGHLGTQLTWMDAKLGEQVITSRHGLAVEINALWHSAHAILAQRLRGIDDAKADHYATRALLIADAFTHAFWADAFGWLYDCVNESGADASLRPNQIFAVSLPHSPLPQEMQKAVVDVVQAELLTPMGLRTLSASDARYRRRYGGCWESRERAYHQGTVWAWLIGPFVEAWLKVHGGDPGAAKKAGKFLTAFDKHLDQAGLGQVSEIFDGDEPHRPRGCFAQAWSVAEVLRAKLLVARAAT